MCCRGLPPLVGPCAATVCLRHQRLPQMAQRPVPEVVDEARDDDTEIVAAAVEVRPAPSGRLVQPARQVAHADGVLVPGVGGARVDPLAASQLLDLPQPLELGSVDNALAKHVDSDGAVNIVLNYHLLLYHRFVRSRLGWSLKSGIVKGSHPAQNSLVEVNQAVIAW